MKNKGRPNRSIVDCLVKSFLAMLVGAGISNLSTGSITALYRSLCCNYSKVTEGVVTESMRDSRSGRQGPIKRYRIIYNYSVNERVYQSNYIYHGLIIDNVTEFLELYGEGDHVQVSYDPDDPEKSVLHDDPVSEGVWFQITVIVLIFPIMFILVAYT